MTAPLGSIVASLGIDRSRWDSDLRIVKKGVDHVQRMFANLGTVAERNFSSNVGKMMGSGMLPADVRATQGLAGTWSKVKAEAQGVVVAVDKIAASMARADNASQRMARGMAAAASGGSPAMADQFSAFRMAPSQAAAVSPMMASMGQGTAANQRLVAGMSAAGQAQAAQARGMAHYREEMIRNMQVTYGMSRAQREAAMTQDYYARSSSTATMRIMEVGRGLEDAAIGYQMQGISGAFRGAANNIGVLLASWGPWPMLIFSTGVALYVLNERFEWFGKHVETAEERLKKFNEQRERATARGIREMALSHSVMSLGGTSGAVNRLEALQQESDLANRNLEYQREGVRRAQQHVEASRHLTREVAHQANLWERINVVYIHYTEGQQAAAQYLNDGVNKTQYLASLQTELNTALDDEIARRREIQAIEHAMIEMQRQEAWQRQTEEARAEGERIRQQMESVRRGREEMRDELRSELDPEGFQRQQIAEQARERRALLAPQGVAMDPVLREQLSRDINRSAAMQLAQLELREFESQNSGVLGGTPQNFATTLESGSQEAFRAIAESRKTQQDPLRELTGISDQQLTQLRLIHRDLQRRAEAEVNVGELDL